MATVFAIYLTFSLLAPGTASAPPSPSSPAADSNSKSSGGDHEKWIWGKDAPKPKPVTPPTPAEIDQSITRGVDFLLRDQNKNGSWGSPTKTKDLNIYAPIPGAHDGYRAATTALAVMALIEVGDRRPAVAQAISRGESWLIDNMARVRRSTPDVMYNVWAHGYAISALIRLRARRPEGDPVRASLEKLIRDQFLYLARYESVDGGWGYYDFRAGAKKPTSSSTSFVNAMVLVAFREAQEAGFTPPADLVKRAIASTNRQAKPDFTFLYGEYLKDEPMSGINRPGGSLARSQACNLALRLWGDRRITDEVLTVWLDRLFARNGWLDMGRKRPVPHESWFAVAGYFYYYGHFYAALCIEQLPVAERARHQIQLARLLLDRQEKDGSWFDYPLYDYGHPYGTAYGLMTMVRCRQTKC